MSSVGWDEVKRLAADFQRAQLSSTSQTLSERNCIEIISKLVELNLLETIYTTDGKEYITPQYLIKEIKDELYVSGGRINLIELSKTLNVDLSHVSAKASEVERSTNGCQLIVGQLIDNNYADNVAYEINDKLKTEGKVNINDLTKVYDLPSDFLQNIVEKNIGKIIQANQDKVEPRLFFTEAFVEHNKAVVRGALAALTKPTQVSVILQLTNIHEREFYSAFENLNDDKQIAGALTAKQGINSLYIPYVYTKQQNEWVDNFFKQNGYLEYDALTRLGISDAISFIRKHFHQGGLVELTSCAVGPQLLSQVNDSIDETIMSGSYLDLTMLLPSVFEPGDVAKVLSNALKRLKTKAVVYTFCDTILVTDKFLQTVTTPFDDIIKKKADEAVKGGAYLKSIIDKKMAKGGGDQEDKVDKKEERRKKAASGKGGGGTQGRETKTRSTKKKQMHKGKVDSDSDEEVDKKGKTPPGQLELITVEEIERELGRNQTLSEDEAVELISALAVHLFPQLSKRCIEAAALAYEKHLVSSAGDRRKRHSELQEKVDRLLNEIRLADKGLKTLPPDLAGKLTSHLLKNTCADLLNSLCSHIADSQQANITTEMRNKIINEAPKEVRDSLEAVGKSLNSGTIDEFLSLLETALPSLDLVFRKADKKKEKSHLLCRREELLSQVNLTDDPACLLHLVVLLLLQYMTQAVIIASAKFVPSLLPLLKTFLSEPDYSLLSNFNDHVLQLLTSGEDSELQNQVKSQLNESITDIRNIVINYKKHSVEK